MRVFVTVGNGREPFDRLLQAVDAAVAELGAPMDGLVQVGHCGFRFRSLPYQSFLPKAEFDAELAKADVVICHAGVGSILGALRAGHTPLVMARRKGHGEVVNDHQEEICTALRQGDRVRVFETAEELLALLRAPPKRRAHLSGAGQNAGVLAVASAIEQGGPVRGRSAVGWAFVEALARLGNHSGSVESWATPTRPPCGWCTSPPPTPPPQALAGRSNRPIACAKRFYGEA